MWIKKIYFLLIIFSLLVFIAPSVNATITVTVTAPSSVTQGSNIPISASFVAGQDGDSGTFYFSCDQTVSGEVDPQSGYSIVSSTSKTYTFTPNTAQTYSNCKVSDGGSQYSSTFAINVVAPSTLTVSGSPSSTTNTSGSTFSLAISITNPAVSAVTTSYSLSCSSHTCSGDQISDTISISAGATTTLQWTVTVGSSSANITFQLGSNSNAFTSSVTVTSTATTTTIGGSGGGGGGGISTGKVTKIKYTFKELKKNTIERWKVNQPGLGLIEMNMTVKNSANNVQITIERYDGRPSYIIHEIAGKIYQYIEINKTNLTDTDIDKIQLKINVNKSWILNNNIDELTVALNRYNNGVWEKLTTTKIEEDNSYVYYIAETTGLSVFAVTGELKAGATTVLTTIPATIGVTTTPVTTISGGLPSILPVGKASITTYALVIILIIVAVVTFWIYRKKA